MRTSKHTSLTKAIRRSAITLVPAAVLWTWIPVSTTQGQEPTQFEVASIKPNDSGAAQMVKGQDLLTSFHAWSGDSPRADLSKQQR